MPYKNKPHRIVPHIHKGRFYNHEGEKKPHVFIPSVTMLLKSHFRKQTEKATMLNWVERSEPVQRSEQLTITWIGHATFLIQIGTINILTDPVFGSLSLLYPRILPEGIPFKQLPPIDFVLISHNHRDHMDAHTLQLLKHQAGIKFLVPQGDKKWFRDRGFDKVIENNWWDHQVYVAAANGTTRIEFTFLPAFHWSQRGVFDYNKSLWGSWMISCNGTTIYFGGDTAYSHHFKCISQEFPVIDFALIPIGPCEPRSIMRTSHINAEEAGQAFRDLGAKHFIPMHWGTYFFGTDNFMLPLDRLNAWWGTANLESDKQLHWIKAGQRITFDTPTIYQRKVPHFSLLEI
ncbi:MBL fold metallo-hydrolase [Candidatus Dependentiae bacterium]|nr:MBL fold metallo-hydrolase [Candidatus Dependentiae bacterium]